MERRRATASSRYTNSAHPMAAATGGDDSLEDFIEEFRPKWGGYLELRMYLGTEKPTTRCTIRCSPSR